MTAAQPTQPTQPTQPILAQQFNNGPPASFYEKITPELLGAELEVRKTHLAGEFAIAHKEIDNRHELAKIQHASDRADAIFRRVVGVGLGVVVLGLFVGLRFVGDTTQAWKVIEWALVFLAGWGATKTLKQREKSDE